MRRKTIILLFAVLVAVSCHSGKHDVVDSAEKIVFLAGDASTKAIMDDSALKTNGNKIRVYDVLTDFTGSVSWMDENNPYYINDEIVYNGNPIWDFVSDRVYPWTTNGNHLFFSWFSYDSTLNKTASDFCGVTFDTATQTLSIPVLEMNTSTDQFDFMYSDIQMIDAAVRAPGSPVNLSMNHLFTAFEITLNNTSGNTILLKSVTLTGLKNKRSASIAFDGASPTISTANLTSTDIPLFSATNQEDGDTYIHEDRVKSLKSFMLMWPQTYAELNGAQIVVVYHIVDSNDIVSDELTANIVMDQQVIFKTNSTGMDAGTKYSFMLQFKKSTIDIYSRVLPWEYEAYDWDYSNHSISARGGTFKDGVLAFYRGTGEFASEPTTEEWSAKTMRFNTRNEVMTGRFYIEAPTSGRWQISAYPLSAEQYFIIEPTSGEIDVNTDNGKAEFTVRVNPDLSPASTQTLFFNVAMYYNGEWHDANSEFNRKNIKLVLDAN